MCPPQLFLTFPSYINFQIAYLNVYSTCCLQYFNRHYKNTGQFGGSWDSRWTWDTDLKYGTVPEKCGTAGNCEHVFCSDDVAKATEARLSLGGRRLLVVAAERRVWKKQKFASKSDSSVADADS